MVNPDYSEYRNFLRVFIENFDPNSQLPNRVPGCKITEDELTGQIISWINQYLNDQSFPELMRDQIVKSILERSKEIYLGQTGQTDFEPLKLMKETISRVYNLCKEIFADNEQLEKIPLPTTLTKAPPLCSVASLKNRRRAMEDRHVIINDLNGIFGIDPKERSSFYGVFDGHAGVDAALYGATHLHCHLVASPHFPRDPPEAMRDAFRKTNEHFLKKNLNSGSTAVCALYCPEGKRLYVGWVGDSKALLARNRNIMQLVTVHKPDVPSEQKRIESLGGFIMHFGGLHRVNGVLSVSRAIGDASLRPFISAEPDIVCVPLTGDEDFLILGCDGLWDHVSEDNAALTIYNYLDDVAEQLRQPYCNYKSALAILNSTAKKLATFAEQQGSTDNISIIIVYLKYPFISTSSWPPAVNSTPLDNMEAAFDNTNCSGFTNSNQEVFQKTNLLSKLNMDDYGTEEDFGPETDVDAVDEAVVIDPQPAKEHIDIEFNKPQTDVINKIESIDPLDNHHHVKDEDGDLIKADIIDLTNNHNNHIEIDNKLIEAVGEDLLNNHTKKTLDFSEKREYSFEREEIEKEVHTLSDVTAELLSTGSVDQISDPLFENHEHHECHDNQKNHIEATPDAETYIVPEPEQEPIVDQTTAENVVVPDSGEDSEDEWDYIKGSEKEVEESRAITQGLAESQEACSDLLHQEQTDDPEITAVESNGVEELSSESIEKEINDIDNGGDGDHDHDDDDDDDDMASQLNPDAKEFIPTSPLRTTPLSSPFAVHHHEQASLHLLQDDQIVAQSPKKYKPMKKIKLPTMQDFESEISQRPGELDDNVEIQRPGSSSSQCSYQEMNLKEAMHGDEKLEYAPDNEVTVPKLVENVNNVNVEAATTNGDDHANLLETLNKSMREQDPMSYSFYNDGSADAQNPFGPDLNAVHQLPEFEENSDNENEHKKDVPSELNPIREDTVEHIGMNGLLSKSSELTSPQNDVPDEISKPEEDQYSPYSEEKDLLTGWTSNNNNNNNNNNNQITESDKPESELLAPIDTLTHELTKQLPLALKELTISDPSTSPQFEAGDFVENIKSGSEKYLESGLSPTAEEFHPRSSFPMDTEMTGSPIEDSAESDICLRESAKHELTRSDDSALVQNAVGQKTNQVLLENVLEAEVESDAAAKIIDPLNNDIVISAKIDSIPEVTETSTSVPEVNVTEELIVTNNEVKNESKITQKEILETESVVTSEVKIIDKTTSDEAALSTAAAAGVAVAAAVGAVAAAEVKNSTSSLKQSVKSTVPAKKPEAKSRTMATTAPSATKKTVSATTTTTTSKPPLAKVTTVPPAKSAPILKSRPINATTNKSIERKPVTLSGTIKKTLVNGDIKSISSTSTASGKKFGEFKPSSAPSGAKTSFSAVTLKSSTARTFPKTTTISSTRAPQTILGKTSLSARLPSKSSGVTVTAKTTKSSASSVSVPPKLASMTKPGSPMKPTTTTTTINNKTKESTSSKQALTTRTVTSSTTAASKTLSPRSFPSTSTSFTSKKTESIKSPTTGAKTITKTTVTKKTVTNGPSSTTSNTTTTTSSGSASKKPATTLATRTSLAPKKSPIKKLGSVNSNTTTTTTTTVSDKTATSNNKLDINVTNTTSLTSTTIDTDKLISGDIVPADEPTTTTTIDSLISDFSGGKTDGNLLIDTNIVNQLNDDQMHELLPQQPPSAIIDLSAD